MLAIGPCLGKKIGKVGENYNFQVSVLRTVDPPPFLGKRDRFVCISGIERNHGGKLRIRDLFVACVALASIDVGNKKSFTGT